MANTVTQSGSVIEITSIDSDYDYEEYQAIHSIQFVPGSAGDNAVFKNGSASAASFADIKISTTDSRAVYFNGQRFHLFFDNSASTISSGAKIIIVLQRHRSL